MSGIRRHAGLAAALVAATAVTAAGAAASPDADVREALLRVYIHGVDDDLARQVLGPGAIPALRRLLFDATFPRRDNVVAFLAHLDRGESTQDLLEFLANPPAPLDPPEEDRALLLAPLALGHIAGRGDRAALGALLEMTGPGGSRILERAAAHGPDPEALLADLIEISLSGLAFSRSSEGRSRLTEIEDGSIRLPVRGRDLRRSARESLDLMDEVEHPGSRRPPDARVPPTDRSRGDSLRLVRTVGAAPGEASGPGAEAADPAVVVHLGPLTYANHPDTPSPFSDGEVDVALYSVNTRAGRADFTQDVSCCSLVMRSGSAQTFGSHGDGLDIVDTAAEMIQVLDDAAARVKVVRQILWCGGSVTNAGGCAWVGGNGVAVVRFSNIEEDGIVWLHEYGHNVGLDHNPDYRYIMFGAVTIPYNQAVTQAECDAFHDPTPDAEQTVQIVGSCTDQDQDQVHDGIDNCLSLGNFSQDDLDHDGRGDPCDADDDGDGADDTSDCSPRDAGLWSSPGEAQNVRFTSQVFMRCDAPADPGSLSYSYERLVSADAADFIDDAICLPLELSGCRVGFMEVPNPGEILYSLIRALNACGVGPLGADSSGAVRQGLACP